MNADSDRAWSSNLKPSARRMRRYSSITSKENPHHTALARIVLCQQMLHSSLPSKAGRAARHGCGHSPDRKSSLLV
jgi:hypothetical protein